MTLTLRHLNLGKVDGKHEYLTPEPGAEQIFFDAYLIPESVQTDRFGNKDIFLSRAFAEQARRLFSAGSQRIEGEQARFQTLFYLSPT